MRGMAWVLAAWLWLLPALAAAQPETARERDVDGICALPGWVATGGSTGDAGRTGRALAEWMTQERFDRLRIDRETKQKSGAEAIVIANIQKPDDVAAKSWTGAYFLAVAYRAAPGNLPPEDGAGLLVARVDPPTPGTSLTPTRIAFRPPETFWRSTWQLAIAGCIQAETAEGATPAAFANRPRLFGLTSITVSSYFMSVLAGIGSAGGLYLLLVLAAAQVHRRQLAYADEEGRPRIAWGRALSPIVLSQDAFGAASLSRFQVLLFTLAAVGVYAYVLVRTGELSSLSIDVLWLLGITLAGSTLASIAGGPVLGTGNRIWLLATGVLDNAPRRPGWHDLLGAEGEIDVTRVQALAFSGFAAAALVFNGPNDLESFAVPDTLKYLIGLSQAVYVAGKALPKEAAKQLNDEVKQLRDAERAALAAPEDTAAQLGFTRARDALQTSLADVFGERFRPARLRALIPGATA